MNKIKNKIRKIFKKNNHVVQKDVKFFEQLILKKYNKLINFILKSLFFILFCVFDYYLVIYNILIFKL
jgi:hypothetical protein